MNYRMHIVAQALVFAYGLLVNAAIFTLVMADRWEWLVLLPQIPLVTIVLFRWTRLFCPTP